MRNTIIKYTIIIGIIMGIVIGGVSYYETSENTKEAIRLAPKETFLSGLVLDSQVEAVEYNKNKRIKYRPDNIDPDDPYDLFSVQTKHQYYTVFVFDDNVGGVYKYEVVEWENRR